MAYLLASELSDISPHLLSLSPLSLIAAAAQYSDNCPNLSLAHLAPGYIFFSAVECSIGFTTGFHNHGEGPY